MKRKYLGILLGLVAFLTAVVLTQLEGTLSWAPSSGTVAGYEVHVDKGDGFPALDEAGAAVDGPTAETLVTETFDGTKWDFVGAWGESWLVKVRAFGEAEGMRFFGPFSEVSEPLSFFEIPGQPGKPNPLNTCTDPATVPETQPDGRTICVPRE